MSTRTLNLNDRLYTYLQKVSVREVDVLARLRAETMELPMAVMQISPEQGQFMALLVRIMGARRCLEVGTFTGYSALACALALPPGGEVVTLDISAEWTTIARRYWADAGVAGNIRLQLGAAGETLRQLRQDGHEGAFDFMFIDADKTGYADYVEQGFHLIRAGGLIAIDNVLWSGNVADTGVTDADTVALRNLNEQLHRDLRFDLSMVPIGDGLTLLHKRA
ncbi:MAG: class I SAM-dependent methyltransferase [Gammaproteobacteria bacterium]|nr:class I SAM-dependent methyltransferase [Gammaproteobacteria bacterium]